MSRRYKSGCKYHGKKFCEHCLRYYPDQERKRLGLDKSPPKGVSMNRSTAERIVAIIINDLSNRNGLGDEWYQIDRDVQREIIETWETLIMEEEV